MPVSHFGVKGIGYWVLGIGYWVLGIGYWPRCWGEKKWQRTAALPSYPYQQALSFTAVP